MALRAVPDHPKFADLQARLDFPRYATLGVLEALWHFCGRFTPQGNIGKYPDSAIEAWLGWKGEPGALIESLVAAHWIDEDESFRLLVHDWATHADKATKQSLIRSKLAFCVPTVHTEREHSSSDAPVSAIDSDVHTPVAQSIDLRPLPVPEPVPEPVPAPDNRPPLSGQVKSGNARWKRDAAFVQFSTDYLATGGAFVDDDFHKAFEFCWKTLDFEQKLDRVKALRAHSEEYHQDPRFIPRPLKFLEVEWERPVKPPANGKPSFMESIESELNEIAENGETFAGVKLR